MPHWLALLQSHTVSTAALNTFSFIISIVYFYANIMGLFVQVVWLCFFFASKQWSQSLSLHFLYSAVFVSVVYVANIRKIQ